MRSFSLRTFVLAVVLIDFCLSIPWAHAQEASQTSLCRVTSRSLNIDPTMAPSITANSGSSPDITSGSEVSLTWEVPSIRSSGDKFLIVGMPESVRFKGDGFIALPPNARAPRSIQSNRTNARIVIPLNGTWANPTGSAAVFFYDSGQLEIKWEIVNVISKALKQCFEYVLASGTFQFNVKLGPAQLISQDRFATGTPKSTYLSNDKRFMLLDFGAIYQVVNRTTGDLLFEHAGAAPRFSHTGRYITSMAGSDRLEVLDILAKKVIFSSNDQEQGDFGGQSVAIWMNEDAFLIFGYGRKGAVGLVLPLIDDRDILSGWVSCNACSAFGSSKMFVDLDQMGIRATHDTFDPFESSMLEVSDPPAQIALWERQNPEERGPPPRRPRFPMEPLHQIAQVEDHLRAIAHTGHQQKDFAWLFSDKIAVAFLNDGQNAELSAKMDSPNVQKKAMTCKAQRQLTERLLDEQLQWGQSLSRRNHFSPELRVLCRHFTSI